MATLIPSLGACVSRMTSGERRLAERLEAKLDDDYLVWYDVPVGPRQAHPDFVVLHPRRGLLVLEVKDWRLDTIRQVDRAQWQILVHGAPKTVVNPFEQARHYVLQVVDALKRDAQLVWPDGPQQGALVFPWSWGVVFANIPRHAFERAELAQAIDGARVLCADEMTAGVDAEAFQSRLWGMFTHRARGVLTLPQIDRIRWQLFPEVRIDVQRALRFDAPEPSADAAAEAPELPDLMRVMDLQQEQLARSLGDGHRVIHGVAGSGKTMILAVRAEQLAQTAQPERPVLVLCFNEPLALTLAAKLAARGLDARVVVRHFHRWCRQQLVAFGQELPPPSPRVFDDMVERVARGVERGLIPAGQYHAVLIDEGHDFEPEWLALVTRMVDPATQSLLLLYDDAQSIYERRRARGFSLKSVGIQAQGRTTVLRINYRNTRQVLDTARTIAAELLRPRPIDASQAAADAADAVPQVEPVSCGREGPPTRVLRCASLQAEAAAIAEHFAAAHEQGTPWSEMAVIGRRRSVLEACAVALRRRRLPLRLRTRTGDFDPTLDRIQLLSMHASKGLEFSLVALPGLGQMPEPGEDEREAARLFYVAATRATEALLLTTSGAGGFGAHVGAAVAAAAPAPRDASTGSSPVRTGTRGA